MISNSTDLNYVGYYADIDEDGKIDGVIFADLLIGNTNGNQWYNNNGSYTIPQKTSNILKEYYISSEKNGEKVISAKGVGEDRFYVMSLKDITTEQYSTFYWYYNAYENMSSVTSNDFGFGKSNTSAIMEKWDLGKVENGGFGEQNDRDIWNYIKQEVNKGWFIPSRAEMSALVNELKISSNFEYGLANANYWCSSQFLNTQSWYTRLPDRGMCNGSIKTLGRFRLATTF